MKRFCFVLGIAAIGSFTLSAAASAPPPVEVPSPSAVAGALVLGGLIIVRRWLKRRD